ncbi:cyclopropane-fatty-acyl-phospholipid synthase family protein [SAR86 cluster bacterium]|nr:cyclopropane-fatty-acyl-phospholipid synthase family protein [SAR86 cluster bacterium]
MLNKVLNYWISKNLKEIEQGTFKLILPNTEEKILLRGKTNLSLEATLEIKSWKALWLIYSRGSLGFTEGYLENYWDTDDLMKLMDLISKNYNSFDRVNSGSGFWKLFTKFSHFRNENSLSGSKKNIHAHYDLGNDFYKSWLDETMTYSSGFFEGNSDNLKEAQNKKYKLILDTLNLPKNSSILEIGCGWGGFLEYASSVGYKIKGITISQEQFKFASNRIKGLTNNPEIELIDYRKLKGKFDAVVSIEMFEAVGSKYWKTYFDVVKQLLKSNGQALIQTITMKEDFYEGYHDWPDFIQTYIFPGGELSSDKVFKENAANSELIASDITNFAASYAKTLEIWYKNFQKEWDAIGEIGFDEKFKRTWDMYLSYCRGGFLNNQLEVSQYKLTHK